MVDRRTDTVDDSPDDQRRARDVLVSALLEELAPAASDERRRLVAGVRERMRLETEASARRRILRHPRVLGAAAATLMLASTVAIVTLLAMPRPARATLDRMIDSLDRRGHVFAVEVDRPIDVPGLRGSATMLVVGGEGRFRLETTLPGGGQLVAGTDGDIVWMVGPLGRTLIERRIDDLALSWHAPPDLLALDTVLARLHEGFSLETERTPEGDRLVAIAEEGAVAPEWGPRSAMTRIDQAEIEARPDGVITRVQIWFQRAPTGIESVTLRLVGTREITAELFEPP